MARLIDGQLRYNSLSSASLLARLTLCRLWASARYSSFERAFLCVFFSVMAVVVVDFGPFVGFGTDGNRNGFLGVVEGELSATCPLAVLKRKGLASVAEALCTAEVHCADPFGRMPSALLLFLAMVLIVRPMLTFVDAVTKTQCLKGKVMRSGDERVLTFE